MPDAASRLRALLHRPVRRAAVATGPAAVCSWEAMRAVYREQAERGDPGAIRGLELIEQDRWPSSGRPRGGSA
jgi:hypothetical protein